MAGSDSGIFLRKASGLVRSASALDVFIFNIGLISVGIGVGLLMYYGAAYYPNANIWAGSLFACVLMGFIATGMLMWSVTLPRSGGIYVFGSRSLAPWLALTLSLVEITAWQAMCAAAAYWIITLGVGPALGMIGYVGHMPSFVAASDWIVSPWPLFLVGSAILVLSWWVCIGGMKRFLLSQKIAFAIAILGSALLIGTLLVGSHDQFIASFNTIMTPYIGADSYAAIIASAKEKGWGASEFSPLVNTLKVSNWAFLPLIGAAFSIAIAGEIKSVSRSQGIGMLGSIAITGLLWVATIFLANHVIGQDFIGAASFNKLEANGGLTTPADPAISLLAGVMFGSPVLTALLSIGIIAWMWLWIPGMHTFAVRAMAAWAFDRIAPEPLGDVSPTRHTPVVGYTVSLIVTVVMMWLLVFTPVFSAVVVFIMMAILAWSIILLAGVWFPYTRPEIYSKSPIANRKFLGLPVMSVYCFLGFLAAQFYFWNLWFDPIAAGHGTVQLETVGVVFLAGIVFYFAMAAYRRTQGIDVRLAFKEIPIE